MATDEIWCEEHGTRFAGECSHPEDADFEEAVMAINSKEDRWQGMDGHMYVGDKNRSSLAYHDTENCRCPGSANFDPDSWY